MTLKDIRINRALALLRIDNFLDKKDILDNKFQINQPLSDHGKYSSTQFLKLLNSIKAEAEDMGGLRIYMASRNADEQELSLIYAPTSAKINNTYTDVEKYYIIDNNGFKKEISKDEAKQYVENYRNEILPILEKELGIHETQTMFYKIEFVEQLRNILSNNTVELVRAFFAGYLRKNEDSPNTPNPGDDDYEYERRLTLIFNLKGPNIVNKIVGKGTGNSIYFALKNSMNADTGNPCPPPNDKPCPGAKLLQ